MEISPLKLNSYLFFKLPSAFLCGVRVASITPNQCTTTVKHKWINQNPFQSMYFAVQAMAAELTTGALVLLHIKKSGKNISMLVTNQSSTFSKKARGRITFSCIQGPLITAAIQKTCMTGEGVSLCLTSIGIDAQGDQVCKMEFEWSLRLKS
ncbi:DUF4442 domain-containing protein [Flavobacterium aciduliphilum]|uniref:Uncharacterized protein DUF4442 n=1 Tax=Flavobacterium aciduliphilum TaxID=1101402 RepID=A0A328YQ51_9FLAO|nr:DUF4442 domain-containing protein [Flavobacterium aciduliphilum]RAR75484.1 uncharacterized protein DUF4442 [Flavobacterium aciduliphilum]